MGSTVFPYKDLVRAAREVLTACDKRFRLQVHTDNEYTEIVTKINWTGGRLENTAGMKYLARYAAEQKDSRNRLESYLRDLRQDMIVLQGWIEVWAPTSMLLRQKVERTYANIRSCLEAFVSQAFLPDAHMVQPEGSAPITIERLRPSRSFDTLSTMSIPAPPYALSNSVDRFEIPI